MNFCITHIAQIRLLFPSVLNIGNYARSRVFLVLSTTIANHVSILPLDLCDYRRRACRGASSTDHPDQPGVDWLCAAEAATRAQISVTPESGFRALFGDDLIQPYPVGRGVLRVRYGQPSGCPILAAALARNRATPARGRNYF